MNELRDYIFKYAERGACRCGKCTDAPPNPEQAQPTGHTADVGFFKVAAREGADAETLQRLIRKNKQGDFADVDVLDGLPHDFTELGAWLGDQALALRLMGLGSVLGLWNLLTLKGMTMLVPKTKP